MNLLFKLMLRAGIAAGGIPAPAMNIVLTSTLDSKITFTRAGSRNYINAGVLTALASSNVPAFESWDGVSRGLAIEPAFTNLLLYSADQTQAAWSKNGGGITAGDAGLGLITQLQEFTSTATASVHNTAQQLASIGAGVTHTFSAFVKAGTGSPATFNVHLHFTNQFNNDGTFYLIRVDGNEGFYIDNSSAPNATNVTYGYKKLSGGVYQVWITGTWSGAGNKNYKVGVAANTAPRSMNYTATVNDKFQVFGCQVAVANGPTGYVATGAATASQAAESAIFNDTAWLASKAQGTFVIEHDCWTGTLIGSGANTVLSATVPGKTAIAWDGTTSDVVSNGGATTAGGLPTFSGSDVRLLSTSGASNTGHIKSIRFYATRLTVEQLQTLTAKTLVSTATPNVLRTVSVNNRLPSGTTTTTGAALTFTTRFKVQIGGHDCSELRLDFPNIGWAASVGNALNIAEVALERESGVVEFVPVYVGGSRSFSIADNAATTVVSDAILPAAFTGLSTFPANMVFWVRVKGSVTTAGHKIPVSRFGVEAGSFTKLYDPATVTYSSIDATGPIIFVSGADVITQSQGYCPILVGKFVSGDPKTTFVVGASVVEGVGAVLDLGSFVRLSAQSTGVPILEISRGGASQTTLQAINSVWNPYLKYSRVLMDEMGTNDPNGVLSYFGYWEAAKTNYGYDKIARIGPPPLCADSGDFTTEAVQTVVRAYPSQFPNQAAVDWLAYGAIDYYFDPQSVRGVNKAKWVVNGVADYATADGGHPSVAGNDLLATEFTTFLNAITVS